MNIRFVYPNVKVLRIHGQKESEPPVFIGCGRFAVLEPNKEPQINCTSLPNGANTPNKGTVDAAISLLSPASFDSSNTIYEIRDEPLNNYQGSSMDLAWLLANIHRGYTLRKWLNIRAASDVWCTGAIEKSGDRPMLSRVESNWFKVKLEAFLSEKNPDRLFIVPAANLAREQEEVITRDGALKLSLDECRKSPKRIEENKKTIITVRPDQLNDLVSFLFDATFKQPAKMSLALKGACLLLLILCVTMLLRGLQPTETLRVLVENGRFSEVAVYASGKRNAKEDDAAISSILQKPLSIDIILEVAKRGQEPLLIPNILGVTPANLVLTPRDQYRLKFAAVDLNDPVYLFIFQEDAMGDVDIAFPNEKWCRDLDNPLALREFPLIIPSHPIDYWFSLDQLNNGPQAQPSIETIYVIASPWPARDVLSSYGELMKGTGAERKVRLAEFVQRLKLRKNSGLPAVFYREIQFGHGG